MTKGKPGVMRTPEGEIALLRDRNKPVYTWEDNLVIFELIERYPEAHSMYKTILMDANMGLVISIAKSSKYQGRGLGTNDLVHAGLLGLARAIDGFDWRRGYRFGTYAADPIKQAISRACTSQGFNNGTHRVPEHSVAFGNLVVYESIKLRKQLGRAPTDDEVAVTLRHPKKKFKKEPARRRVLEARLQQNVRTLRLDGQLDDDDGRKVADVIADARIMPVDQHLAAHELIERCLASFGPSQKRERDVFIRRLGIGQSIETNKDIGPSWGISRARVQQIEKQVIDRLCKLHMVTLDDIREAVAVLYPGH